MERRALSFLITLSIFLTSFPVLSHTADPFKYNLGEESLASWNDEIVSSNDDDPGSSDDVSTLVLAENRTKRPDFLSRFHKYRGGWDFTNIHYCASVGFTGAAAFIISMLWFISFGLALLVHHFCGWKLNFRGKESIWSLRICLLLLIIFTSGATIGCILLSLGQDEFHREALGTLSYVVNQSDYRVQILRNVSEYMSLAKNCQCSPDFSSF